MYHNALLVLGLLSSIEAFLPVGPPRCLTSSSSDRASLSSPLRADIGTVGDEYDEDFDAYARDLDPKEARSQVDRENKEYAIVDRTALWMRAVRFPFRMAKKILPTKKIKPGKLILLRCGESTWNANQTFTGWADPDLTKRGLQESQHAAR